MTPQEEFVARLVNGINAGFWQRDEELQEVGNVTLGRGTPIPWAAKTCKDCPFFSMSVCQVHVIYRGNTAATCEYFDPHRHAEAQNIIQQRQWSGLKRFLGGGL